MVPAASKKKLGVALCGLGSLSTYQLAPALQKTKNCRLAGIITGTPAKAVKWQAKFPGGAISHCGSSYSGAAAGYFRAIAERGWFGLDPAFDYGGIRGMRSDGKPIDRQATDQFAVEMDDFARCIEEKTTTKVPGEEGLRDVKIMMAIYESARTGMPIHLRDA
jgi:predicted dehydrogenase